MSSAEDNTLISTSKARELLRAACLRAGAGSPLADSLVAATLSAARFGPIEMGFPHFMDYLDALHGGRIAGHAEPRLSQPLPTRLHADALRGIAQLGFDRAFDQICAIAHAAGTCLFTQGNSFTAGELGYYVRRLAEANLIGMAFANGPALMAASAGGPRVYCTNPIAFGAPLGAERRPLVIDQATSATAFVKVAQAAREGVPLAEGWATDEHGAPTTDAAAAVRGALLPFGGYKGANLALMVEVLAAGLSRAAWSTDAPSFDAGGRSPQSGLTVVAFAPVDDQFAARTALQLDHLTALGVSIPSQRRGYEAAGDESLKISRALLLRLESPG